MPRVNLAHQSVVRTGLSVSETAGDPANNHETPYVAHCILRARNAHATLARTVTIITPANVDVDLAIPDRVVSIPALATRYVGPFTEDYRQADDKVHINVETSDLNLAVLKA